MVGINLGTWSLGAGEEDTVAFEGKDQCCTYKEARVRASRIAAGLFAAGVRPGDGVALLLPNSVRAALSIFGIWTAGASIVSLRPQLTNYEIGLCLGIWPAKWALTSSGCADRFVESPSLIHVLDIEEVERSGGDFVASTVPLDTPAIALFTSGSTGEPKAVIHSARSMALQTTQRKPYRGASNSSAGAAVNTTLQTLQAGGTQIFIDESVTGIQLANALLHHRVDQARIANNTLTSLVEAKQQLGPSVRQLMCGGDFMSAAFQQYASEVLGLPVIQVYGATEAFAMTRGNEETPQGSIGRTLPQVELQLRSEEDGSLVSGDGKGLAWVRSPKLFMGYGKRGAIEKPFDEDGWFKTDDVLRRDSHGNYYFLSRMANYLKINTVRVGAYEIEDVLRRDPAVRNAHVTCLNLSGEQDTVMAVLEVDQVDSHLASRLKLLMDTYLAKFKHPRAIYATNSFSYSPSGKIDARALQDQIRSGHLRQITPAS